tara:strand:+ start:10 stop:198 length:189 start_codon:yes stop_codon:yes gene_type:complete
MTFEIRLKTAVLAQVHLISLIDEAARTERFLSKPRPPRAVSMYDLLTLLGMKKVIGPIMKKL